MEKTDRKIVQKIFRFSNEGSKSGKRISILSGRILMKRM